MARAGQAELDGDRVDLEVRDMLDAVAASTDRIVDDVRLRPASINRLQECRRLVTIDEQLEVACRVALAFWDGHVASLSLTHPFTAAVALNSLGMRPWTPGRSPAPSVRRPWRKSNHQDHVRLFWA